VASILQDLNLFETILGDVAAFAAGQPVSTTATVGSETYSVSVTHLPNGPVAPYQVIAGNFFAVLGMVLADAAAISAGAPLNIAEKIGNTWYGTALTVVPKAA
jgi:hypothetical protein